MKKILMLSTIALLVTCVSFGHDHSKKKGAKAKSGACKKGGACCKDKAKTAQM